MTKRMLIDAAHAGETRVAILEDDFITDYDFTTTAKSQLKGNIYLAKITRVEPSLQAAFVEYGGGKQGFLPFAEIHPDYYQLPQEDKQQLLAEQIAEAEAEEAAEDEAFEREQAAREARARNRRGSSEAEEEESDEAEEDFAPENLFEARAQIARLIETAAAHEPTDALPVPSVPALEMPQAFAPDEAGDASKTEALQAESFHIASDALDGIPGADAGTTPQNDTKNAEEGVEESYGERGETTSEDAEETRGRRDTESRAIHRRYRIQEVIKRNQIVLVQVIKEERGNKGCSLTTYISLAGRCAVLMPNSPKGGGISRKITDRETRKRLKEIAAEMRTHRGMSVIIRTAGIDRTKAEIRRDYEYLVKLWNQVRENTLSATAPALIYEEGNLIKRALRDQYSGDMEEVIVEGEEAFTDAREFMKMLMPSHAPRVKLYKGGMPLFSYAGVEEQLTGMMEPQVKLPSGGYIVIHATEALIAIDVNSGRSTTERNVEETALKTNLEAAAEAARQLRLRDLAGLIVIDFIDMNYGKNRKAVERAMKDALRADRAKIQLGRISMFGLMELSRQRMRPSMSEAMGVICPHCRGTGYIHSVETVAIQIIRTLEKEAASGDYQTLRVTTHPEAALHLLNDKRGLLQSLEERYHVSVVVLMDSAMITGNYRLIKVNHEGKEALHEDSKQPRRRSRGGRGRGRSRGKGDEALSFSGAVEPGDDADLPPMEPEEETAESEDESEGQPRRRRERGRRGGRGRNRVKSAEGDGDPDDAGAEESGENETANLESENDDGERRSRRRGRRGGRGRRDRQPRGDAAGAHHTPSDETAAPAQAPAPAVAADQPVYATTAAPEEPAAAPRGFVIPLSEAQTNPGANTTPVQSEGDDAKPKRKGWFSRVLES